MSRSARTRPAFTLVEMLVVISVMALLMAVLLPALAGVKKRSKKLQETSNIRQVGVAWNQYGTANDGAAVPGYLDPVGNPNIIERWDLSLEYPNHVPIPDTIAAPWTWRLMTYIDNSQELIHGYAEEDDPGLENMIAKAAIIADEPAFGYNAYYTGGWWEIATIETQEVAVPRFYDATDEDGRAISVVAKSIAQIQRTSDYIVFCSSTKRDDPTNPDLMERAGPALDTDPGSFLVTPPYLADEQQWSEWFYPNHPDSTVTEYVTTFASPAYHPIGRYTGSVAIVYADGHTNSDKPGALDDARMWINAADTKDFIHLP